MIDKRFWTGAIAVVTLIVAGAGALPELLLGSASSGPTVVLPVSAPRGEPVARLEQVAPVVRHAPMPPASPAATSAPPRPAAAGAPPQPAAPAPEPSKLEPEAPVAAAPAPTPAFPPVQAVGIAASSVQDVVPLATPPAAAASAHPNTEKPARSEPSGHRSAKPRQNVRPAAYPMAEFLVWRR